MNLLFLYGAFSTGVHGGFVADALLTPHHRGLTGSESFFWYMVREMARRGHKVTVRCAIDKPTRSLPQLHGAEVLSLAHGAPSNLDVAISWNEPDLLRSIQSGVKRVCVQQLNDFNFCSSGYASVPDLILCPSVVHRAHLVSTDATLDPWKLNVLGNCIDLEDFAQVVPRDNNKFVYCSSPDRGLHWVLDLWSDVKSKLPKAELHIYYRVEAWLRTAVNVFDPDDRAAHRQGIRARYIDEALTRLKVDDSNGVYLHGAKSNAEVRQALLGSGVFFYPCAPVSFTEGFSVATLEACASGIVPVISDADALGSIYKDAALVIPGNPGASRSTWISTLVAAATDLSLRERVVANCKKLASQYTVQQCADAFEAYLK